MKFLELWRRLLFFVRREQFHSELEDEMRLHAELRAEALQEDEGLDAAQAARLGRKRFGNITALREDSYQTWSIRWVEEAARDVRFAMRQIRKAPGHTVVAVLSIALGIGANAAIYSMIESALLRPIAVKDVEQLRLLTWRSEESRRGWVAPSLGHRSSTYGWMYEQRATPDGALIHVEFSPPFYRQFLDGNKVFESLFGFTDLGRVTALVERAPEPVNVFLVSGDFYRGMQVSPILGRAIGPEDDVRGGSSVAMISYDYWVRRFSRNRAVIGEKIELNGVPVTIVGVNPESFTGVVPGGDFEIWAPLHLPPAVYGSTLMDNDQVWRIQMMGRLKQGVSESRAQSEMNGLFQQLLDAKYRDGPLGDTLSDPAKRPKVLLMPGARGVDYVTDHYSRMLYGVLALAGLVLLIACANVANLLLAKSSARRREISMRLALGAGRGRIARQLLAEGLLLASMAGLAGVAIGYFARNGIPALLATPWRPNPFEPDFDASVLLVCLGTTFVTGILFSLAPMWQSRKVEVDEALKDGGRSTTSFARLRMGGALVVLQIALSVVLIAGAGMCVRTFSNLRSTALGLRPEGVVLFTLEPPNMRYAEGRMTALFTRVQQAIREVPGVQSASFSDSGGGAYVGPGNRRPEIDFRSYAPSLGVGSEFFETMGIPLLYGRAIDQHDVVNGQRAVVVNQEFGRHFFGRENTVGMTFMGTDGSPGADGTLGSGGVVPYQIVGVCANWRVGDLRDSVRGTIYTAVPQTLRVARGHFKVRIAGDEAGVLEKVREVVHSVDADQAVLDVRTQTAEIENSLAQESLIASLATVFGGLALVLAAIGIYGLMAYSVARRTNEIGIRVALGARPPRVAWMVLRETLWLAVIGIAIGIPTVIVLGPILDHELAPAFENSLAYGLKPNDPITIAVAALVLAAAAALSGYVPARRAARVDPMVALRHD